jgi:hypothetical protein
MVIGHFSDFLDLVAFVGAIGNPPIELALPISDTFLAAEIDAKVSRFRNLVLRSNLRPDHVVEQTIVVEIPLKRSHAREIVLLPLVQKSATLFIRHWFPIVGHKQYPLSDNGIQTVQRELAQNPTFGQLTRTAFIGSYLR